MKPWTQAKRDKQALNNQLIKTKQTSNRGRGIFALTSFKKDEIVCSFRGTLVRYEDLTPSDKQYHMVLDNESGKCILPDYRSDDPGGHLINHSCRPNVGMGAVIKAFRPISSGEEITVYYGDCANYNRACLCGEPYCAGFIGLNSELPLDPQMIKILQTAEANDVVWTAVHMLNLIGGSTNWTLAEAVKHWMILAFGSNYEQTKLYRYIVRNQAPEVKAKRLNRLSSSQQLKMLGIS